MAATRSEPPVPRSRLAGLLALGWLAFTVAVFWGLFFAPVLAMRGGLDEQRVVQLVEGWWQTQLRTGATVVLLAPSCPCSGGADGWQPAAGFAEQRVAANADFAADLQAALPTGARLDTLVFDAAGQLRFALDRHDAAHCIDVQRLLKQGLPALAKPWLRPGLCACTPSSTDPTESPR